MNDPRNTPPGTIDASIRVPPHNLHAEQAVLASVLLNNDHMSDVVEILRADDFYQGAHRTLFEAMLGLFEAGRPIDHLTLSAVIRDKGAEQQVGGLAYLAEIVSAVPISENAAEYATIVKEKSILRKSIAAAQEISASAFQGVGDLREFLDRMEERIFAISGEEVKPKYFSMNEMARAALKDIETAYTQKKRITGIPSGFRDLDEITAGFQRSNMIVVAARPAMGKTSLCLNIAVNAAMRHKVPVAIFSLEMSRQELAMRMICSEARVNFQKLRTGAIGQEEINRLVGSVAKLSDAPIYTDDSGMLTALDLRARARRLKKDKGIGLVIIDYLQLMRGSSGRSNPDNRVQEVSEISRSMKALAKELDIPVIAISQLSRGVESRNDKRPQMADLRESGAIEQDSDLILFVYREEMYSKEKTPQEEKGIAEIIVGKNRSGPMRDVKLAFLSQYTRFEDLAQDFE
jgi:replicative DNA helicase